MGKQSPITPISVLYYEHPGPGLGGSRRSLLNMIRGMGDSVRAYIVGQLPEEVVRALPKTSLVLPSSRLWPPDGRVPFGRVGKTILWVCYMGVTVVRLLFIIWRDGIDVVHANNDVTSNAPAIIAAKLTRRPCVCHLRGTELPWRETRWLFKHVDRYIAISRYVRDYYAGLGLLTRKRVSVIYNGVDVRALREQTARPSRDPNRPFRIAMIGRMIEYKGHAYFLDAAAEVLRSRKDVEFVVYGPIPEEGDEDYPYYKEMCRKRDELDLGEAFSFAGVYTDVAEAMSNLNVILCCSPVNNFERVLFEAMACGVPVVAFDAGGIREVARPGENCILVPNRNATAMAEATLSLIEDPALRDRLVSGGRATAEKLFDHRANAEKVLIIYKGLLPGR